MWCTFSRYSGSVDVNTFRAFRQRHPADFVISRTTWAQTGVPLSRRTRVRSPILQVVRLMPLTEGGSWRRLKTNFRTCSFSASRPPLLLLAANRASTPPSTNKRTYLRTELRLSERDAEMVRIGIPRLSARMVAAFFRWRRVPSLSLATRSGSPSMLRSLRSAIRISPRNNRSNQSRTSLLPDRVLHGRDERAPFPVLKEYELLEFSSFLSAGPLITSAISRSKAAPRGRSSFKTKSRARLHKYNARRRYALCSIEGRRPAREYAASRSFSSAPLSAEALLGGRGDASILRTVFLLSPVWRATPRRDV